eukprot:593765-Rhodomonas_salina.1
MHTHKFTHAHKHAHTCTHTHYRRPIYTHVELCSLLWHVAPPLLATVLLATALRARYAVSGTGGAASAILLHRVWSRVTSLVHSIRPRVTALVFDRGIVLKRTRDRPKADQATRGVATLVGTYIESFKLRGEQSQRCSSCCCPLRPSPLASALAHHLFLSWLAARDPLPAAPALLGTSRRGSREVA